ncbi:MAG: hypothetical protein WAX89_07340 [Alphaproteobacteria bacterium]
MCMVWLADWDWLFCFRNWNWDMLSALGTIAAAIGSYLVIRQNSKTIKRDANVRSMELFEKFVVEYRSLKAGFIFSENNIDLPTVEKKKLYFSDNLQKQQPNLFDSAEKLLLLFEREYFYFSNKWITNDVWDIWLNKGMKKAFSDYGFQGFIYCYLSKPKYKNRLNKNFIQWLEKEVPELTQKEKKQ